MGCRKAFDSCFCVDMGTNQTNEYDMSLEPTDGGFLVDNRCDEWSRLLKEHCMDQRVVIPSHVSETKNHAAYVHDRFFTPEPQLLDRYLHHWIQWDQYSAEYRSAMEARNAISYFQEHYGNYSCVCLIGTATKRRRSHSEVLRGLLADSKRLAGE